MANQPNTPPASMDENLKDPVSQVMQSTSDDKVEAIIKEKSPSSVFMNMEPIREDQVQNAVKFLSHPKVTGSPVMYRRSFLEKKGLTKEEIDEAFRRVPDPTPAATTTQPVVSGQDGGQIKSSPNVQLQPPTPVESISKIGTLSRFHWSHALLAAGFLAVSGAGTAVLFKNSIVPRFKSWIRKVVAEEEEKEVLLNKNNLKPTLEEEATAAAKAAAAAAADVARASQEMVAAKIEEKRCFEELISMLNTQVKEMKSMSNSIQKLEGVRSLSPPPAYRESSSPPPEQDSYSEILDMIQRGETPSEIRDVIDAPANPRQQVNPRLAQRSKPWEINQSQNSSINFLQTREGSNGSTREFPYNNLSENNPWQQKNVRITEIESVDEQKFGYSNGLGNARPIQKRSWVPPQPPPVVMPEAAAAIRQPKKLPHEKEQMTDDQLLDRAPETTDELQRITKISESGGFVESNGESSGIYSSEVQAGDNGSYL